MPAMKLKAPYRKTGPLIGWKKCYTRPGIGRAYVVKLRIPAKAKRVRPPVDYLSQSRKCRAAEARVLGFYDYTWGRARNPVLVRLKNPPKRLYASSPHAGRFAYVVGKTVKPEYGFDPSPWYACRSGIHFFMSFEEAARY